MMGHFEEQGWQGIHIKKLVGDGPPRGHGGPPSGRHGGQSPHGKRPGPEESGAQLDCPVGSRGAELKDRIRYTAVERDLLVSEPDPAAAGDAHVHFFGVRCSVLLGEPLKGRLESGFSEHHLPRIPPRRAAYHHPTAGRPCPARDQEPVVLYLRDGPVIREFGVTAQEGPGRAWIRGPGQKAVRGVRRPSPGARGPFRIRPSGSRPSPNCLLYSRSPATTSERGLSGPGPRST